MSSHSLSQAEMPAQLPPVIDSARAQYPFCIVWSPIPILSWFLPFVGHVGVCDSHGHIYDFQGSYRIGQDRMLFGNPVKYWDLSRYYIPSFYTPNLYDSAERGEAVRREVAAYDKAVASTVTHFQQCETYNFFTNNCHALAAASMNQQCLKKRKMGTVSIAIGMMLHGRYISLGHFMKAHLPFILLIAVVFILLLGFL
ncbi:hypothetical protein JKF63_03253 [Porcisia hertigi]|uniref:Uncharacterized protein n=1 Tax=Porcisia hertigi TaxID=2761500 RepID=A0A836LAQ6_9TRYP|nr:hypothetical protein JKF63_03253 [Porcisia hertigi]